jgi:hypothetical protein
VVVSQAHFCGKKEEKTEETYGSNPFTALSSDDSGLPF